MTPAMTSSLRGTIHAAAFAVCCTALLASTDAPAFQASIQAGSRALYLQVGAGSMVGGGCFLIFGTGCYSGGATPGNNLTVNTVSTSIAASAIGTGPQAMSTDSTVTYGSYNGTFTNVLGGSICVPGNGEVYVGGFYRTPGTAGNATLSVTTPTSLVNATSDTIPFSSISWTSSDGTVPAGTFAGGSTQTLGSLARNNWFESCLTFQYANAGLAPAGTFRGRATYQLVAP